MYTDESGEFFFTILSAIFMPALLPVAIGADIGLWSGGAMANQTLNPLKWDYSSGKTWGYMLGGAVAGGASGYIGGLIAGSGIPFANTASLTNSLGTWAYTGGKTDINMSLGVASYNFKKGSFGYLGKKGNKWFENLGYSLGGLANFRDINQIINSTSATLFTDNNDFISHSAIADDNGNPLMSFGPNDNKVPSSKLGYATYFRKSTSDYTVYPTLPIELNVNKYAIDVVRGFGKILPFQGITSNCVNMASLSLWLNGIPNFGLHPYLLYATIWAYSSGIRADLFSHHLIN